MEFLLQSSKRIFPLCQALTRTYGVLDHKNDYKEEKVKEIKEDMSETPLYRSFFQHKLFDKNMLHLIKQNLETGDCGGLLLSVGILDKRYSLFDTVNGMLRTKTDTGSIIEKTVHLSFEGGCIDSDRRLFLPHEYENVVSVLNFEQNKEVSRINIDYPIYVAINNEDDTHFLFVRTAYHTIHVYNKKIEFQHVINMYHIHVNCFCLHKQSRRVLVPDLKKGIKMCSFDGEPVKSTQYGEGLNGVKSIAVDKDGNIYTVCDSSRYIWVFALVQSKFLPIRRLDECNAAGLQYARQLIINPKGDRLYVLCRGGHINAIIEFSITYKKDTIPGVMFLRRIKTKNDVITHMLYF